MGKRSFVDGRSLLGVRFDSISLSQDYYCCYEHQDQKQVGEERIYSAYTSHHSSSLNGIRTETQTRQEPGDRN